MTKKMLVLCSGPVKTFAFTLPAFEALRDRYPNRHITLFTTKEYECLAQSSPYFDDVAIDTHPKLKDFKDWWSLRRWLHEQKFSYVYDFDRSARSDAYYQYLMPRKEIFWSGTASGCMERITPQKGHIYKTIHKQMSHFSHHTYSPTNLDWVENIPSKNSALILPGSEAEAPQWPAACYADVCKMLLDQGIQPAIAAPRPHLERAYLIAELCAKADVLTGHTDPADLLAHAKAAKLILGDEGGYAELATQAQTECFILRQGKTYQSEATSPYPHLSYISAANLNELTAAQVMNKLNPKSRHNDFTQAA